MKAGETIEQGGKEYLVLGKTFGTKTRLSPGDRFLLEGETLNLERDDEGKTIKASVWVPEVIEATDKAADSLETIVKRAKEHGVLQEKVRHEGGEVEYLPTDAGKPSTTSKEVAEKAGAESYPDEDKKLRFVAQNHYRGKSCHLDLRFEFKRGNTDYLRGWTVAHQVAGAIKAPVTTMGEAEKLDTNPRNWKMDLKTGLVKPRQIRDGTVRRGDLRAFQKAAEIPKDWLNTEGVTKKQDPGEPPPAGATKQYPGVFTILDKGEVEWGAQKPWFHEWFLEGSKWHGRWCFRLVKREGEKFFSPESAEEYEAIKAEVLPPGKEEEGTRIGSFWLLMQPKVQTPYVLSKEATSENWLPPKGVSCLPAKMRASVPKELRYWEMDRKEALEARDKLAEFEELGGTELKLLVLREVTDE